MLCNWCNDGFDKCITVSSGTLDLYRASKIENDANLTVSEGATLKMDSSTAALNLNSGDSISGAIINADSAKFTSSAGNVIIGGDSAGKLTWNNTNDSIGVNSVLQIKDNGTLKESKGSVVVNANDTWEGAIEQDGGTMTLTGRDDTTNDKQKINQTAGTLNV